MNQDLLKAILAMDSYNRNYNEGLVVEGDQLGEVSIVKIQVDNEWKVFDSELLVDSNGVRWSTPNLESSR